MNYKIIADVNISGNKIGDTIEAEPHAMEAYIARNEVELVVEAPKAAPKAKAAPKVAPKK
ncbi:MAG: hypothetical protein GY849_02975 [Deltaproteobacteria bacterium]|nr:hypothetical protein [Deltaproteobacteria bacterium]